MTIENDEREDCKAVTMIIRTAGTHTDYNSDRLYTLDNLESNGILFVGGDAVENDSQHHNNSNLDGCMAQLTINDIGIHLINDARYTGPINAKRNMDSTHATC